MNTPTPSQIPEGHIDGLPEKFQPFAIRFRDLQNRKIKLDAEIPLNRQKLTEAEAERSQLQQSGPPDETTVRKLSEAHIRCELYVNHQAKLDEALRSLMKEARAVGTGLSREIKKTAVEYQHAARRQFIDQVQSLVIQGERDVQYALSALQSRAEKAAEVIAIEVEYYHESIQCSFEAWEALLEILERFTAAIATATPRENSAVAAA